MDELIGYLGAAEGCPVCADKHCASELPFISDVAAVSHIAQHSPAELAFALLSYKAIVQHALVSVDEPGGIRTERHLDELIMAVEETARRSPARPEDA